MALGILLTQSRLTAFRASVHLVLVDLLARTGTSTAGTQARNDTQHSVEHFIGTLLRARASNDVLMSGRLVPYHRLGGEIAA